MKLKFIYIFLLVISCGGESDIPSGVLSMDKMARIMTDIHLVEGAITYSPDIRFEPRQRAVDYYQAVRKIHEVDSAEFRKSFEYYAKHPVYFAKIYDQVLENLNQLQTKR